ncbi:MAG TPA: VOC family protein [Spirochaetota bacterium]|jgi:metallothiol transferase|nr:VOC family protein [Spirochaetota bacterium]HQO02233.1 VOC family protein [Spirochaetota bacterium]HQP49752.1 VOC family protein [Spirochaetota bacterium]
MIVIEEIDHIGLTVSNLENSIEFYKELFDFELVEKITNARQAFIRVSGILIGLYEVEGYKATEGTRNHLSFYIDEEDFDDAVEEIKSSDIPIISGPENIRKGQSVVFLDPDGNQIELCYPRMNI